MASEQTKTTKSPLITVVVGTLNRPQLVSKLITELANISETTPLELIVIDQSDMKDFRILQEKFPRKKFFILEHFEKANTCKYLNFGWKIATAPIVLYLDDDVTISEKSISAHISAYKDGSILAVAGRVINDNEKISKDSKVGKILWFGASILKNFSYEHKTFVDFPYGCNMSYRKNILQGIGGFDEKLAPPIYAYNEIDLGFRISSKHKNSFIFLPDALVYHHQYKTGGTRDIFNKHDVYQSTQSNYGYFLGKNFSYLQNLIALIRRSIYQVMHEPKAIPMIISGLFYGKKLVKP